MTDHEINEAVARKLGYVRRESIQQGYYEWIDPKNGLWVQLPDYCQSIEVAWGIVNRLKDMPFEMMRIKAGPGTALGFGVRFSEKEGAMFFASTHPARAICLAFLAVPTTE